MYDGDNFPERFTYTSCSEIEKNESIDCISSEFSKVNVRRRRFVPKYLRVPKSVAEGCYKEFPLALFVLTHLTIICFKPSLLNRPRIEHPNLHLNKGIVLLQNKPCGTSQRKVARARFRGTKIHYSIYLPMKFPKFGVGLGIIRSTQQNLSCLNFMTLCVLGVQLNFIKFSFHAKYPKCSFASYCLNIIGPLHKVSRPEHIYFE